MPMKEIKQSPKKQIARSPYVVSRIRKGTYQSRALEMCEKIRRRIKRSILCTRPRSLRLVRVYLNLWGVPGWSELIRSLTVNMMTRKVSTAMELWAISMMRKRWKTIAAMQEMARREPISDKPILMMARTIKGRVAEISLFW